MSEKLTTACSHWPQVSHGLPNRHRAHAHEFGRQYVAPSRCIIKDKLRVKIPIALAERPPWTLNGPSRLGPAPSKAEWATLSRARANCDALISSKQVETRLHAAFALARCSHEKANRVPLGLTPGLIEAVSHTLRNAEPSESGRRCQLHSLTVLHNILLESPKVDVFIGHDEGVVRGLLHVMGQDDVALQELAITCLDFMSISEPNQPVLCYEQGMLDGLAQLLRSTRSGFAVYHALHTITYLTTCRRNHHRMAHNRQVVGVLLDTIRAHDEDPARCQQGLVALCNLMSEPGNAASLESEYGVRAIIKQVQGSTTDEDVLTYCAEAVVRLNTDSAAAAAVLGAESTTPSLAETAPAAPATERTVSPPASRGDAGGLKNVGPADYWQPAQAGVEAADWQLLGDPYEESSFQSANRSPKRTPPASVPAQRSAGSAVSQAAGLRGTDSLPPGTPSSAARLPAPSAAVVSSASAVPTSAGERWRAPRSSADDWSAQSDRQSAPLFVSPSAPMSAPPSASGSVKPPTDGIAVLPEPPPTPPTPHLADPCRPVAAQALPTSLVPSPCATFHAAHPPPDVPPYPFVPPPQLGPSDSGYPAPPATDAGYSPAPAAVHPPAPCHALQPHEPAGRTLDRPSPAQSRSETLALLDRYEAELRATMADMQKGAGMDLGSYPSLQPRSSHSALSPPRAHPASGRLASPPASSTPPRHVPEDPRWVLGSPGGASELWSVSESAGSDI